MIYWNALIRSLVSLLVLFVFAKLIGKRQISDMSMFDYINGITIGSIAGEMATGVEQNMWVGIIAMSVYGLIALAVDIINRKSIRARRFFSGTPTLLFREGKFMRKNFAKAQISVSEFEEMCRIAGYYDLSAIQSAQLESSGGISILPKKDRRQVTLADLNLSDPTAGSAPVSVIYDGKILEQNLVHLGKNESWVMNQLAGQKVALADVFLATVSGDGQLSAYLCDS